jgi:hypothetical protein
VVLGKRKAIHFDPIFDPPVSIHQALRRTIAYEFLQKACSRNRGVALSTLQYWLRRTRSQHDTQASAGAEPLRANAGAMGRKAPGFVGANMDRPVLTGLSLTVAYLTYGLTDITDAEPFTYLDVDSVFRFIGTVESVQPRPAILLIPHKQVAAEGLKE